MEGETAGSRRKRKEEAKLLKRQRIEQSGGVRPRNQLDGSTTSDGPTKESSTVNFQSKPRPAADRNNKSGRNAHVATASNHRFGRVMENVPCRNQARLATVSIAIPGSVVANCQTRELKTQISGQIARAATIYHVDEIIVFDDKLSKRESRNNYYHRNRDDSKRRHTDKDEAPTGESKKEDGSDRIQKEDSSERSRPSDPHTFMARILQYCECPQYLRRHFFPMHPDLQFAGLLAPVDAPHHVRAEDRCPFREGVVLLDQQPTHHGTGSLVNCGIRSRPVQCV
jgi:Putative RNA methyltransferase